MALRKENTLNVQPMNPISGSQCSPAANVAGRCVAAGSGISDSTVCGPQSTVYGLRSASAFTLLELMIVMGIIAVLALLLFPVVIGAGAKAKEKQAMAESRTILMAIKAYRQEYGRWPAQTQIVTQDTTYITNNYLVIQPLLGSNRVIDKRSMNPKNKIFLNMQVSTNNPDYVGNYLDPWGIPYVICMDDNGDNSLLIGWINRGPYAADNSAGRQIGATNISLATQSVANVDAGVASLGGTANNLRWNTWTEMP